MRGWKRLSLLMGWTAVMAGWHPVPDAWAAAATSPSSTSDIERPSIIGRRIVRHFDFSEEPLGNFESVPMFWRRLAADGFPPYLEGRFDAQVGRSAVPSFRLDLDGGSIAYRYEGRDISVRSDSDYLVVAWVRTQGLDSARAYLTAVYLDRRGDEIPGTVQRSRLVGGTPGADAWQPISVGLPGGVAHARYIGTTLWLTQAKEHDRSARPVTRIEFEDVRGSAWFDDLTVFRLPRVQLRPAVEGNLFVDPEPVELLAEVHDPDGLRLEAMLRVRDMEGRLVVETPVEVLPQAGPPQQRSTGPQRIALSWLDIGAYDAELLVTTADASLVRRTLRFARAGPRMGGPAARGRGFGVELTTVAEELFAPQQRLLAQLSPEWVKLPVWNLEDAVGSDGNPDRAIDHYVESVAAMQATPVGVMAARKNVTAVSDAARSAPGNAVGMTGGTDVAASRPAFGRELLPDLPDLLSGDPATWQPLIAANWSRYAGLIPVWQLGGDADGDLTDHPRLPDGLMRLRQEMLPILRDPRLAVSGGVLSSAFPNGIDYRSVRVPTTIPPDDFEAELTPLLKAGPPAWLTLELLPESGYQRVPRLADLAKRLAQAAFVQPAGISVAAPWSTQIGEGGAFAEPSEDYLVFRTLADLLGGSTPVARMTLDGTISCLVFDHHGTAVLFAWDDRAPPYGREHLLSLGQEIRMVDLWGRQTAPAQVGSSHLLTVGPTPVLITGAVTWLLNFRREFLMEDPLIEANVEIRRHMLRFRNTFPQPVSGMVRLVAPPDWDIRPNRIPFMLQPGEVHRVELDLRFPLNAEAGVTPILGEFDIDADRRYHLLTPAWFELGLRDIDLQTSLFRAGDKLIVRQELHNASADVVSFDGYVMAPGRQRVTRLFPNSRPGQRLTREFVLDGAEELAGRQLRVGLKEIRGTRVWNQIVTAP